MSSKSSTKTLIDSERTQLPSTVQKSKVSSKASSRKSRKSAVSKLTAENLKVLSPSLKRTRSTSSKASSITASSASSASSPRTIVFKDIQRPYTLKTSTPQIQSIECKEIREPGSDKVKGQLCRIKGNSLHSSMTRMSSPVKQSECAQTEMSSESSIFNPCVDCGTNTGSYTRQLCGKTFCYLRY